MAARDKNLSLTPLDRQSRPLVATRDDPSPSGARSVEDGMDADSRVPVTVIVCVRNRAIALTRCLSAVAQAKPAETIVIDGHSTDGTAAIAGQFGVRVMDDAGVGLGAARALGAKAASYEIIVFVDSDTVIGPSTLPALRAEVVSQGWVAVQAQLLTLDQHPSYWQRAEEWRRKKRELPGEATAVGCQATAMIRSWVVDVGFDPAFEGAAEDGDFCFRVRARGGRVGFSASAVAYHQDRRTFAAFARQRLWHGRGLARMRLRHGREYGHVAALQARSAGSFLAGALRYLPYMAVSTIFLGLGMVSERITLALRPELRSRLQAANAEAPAAQPRPQ